MLLLLLMLLWPLLGCVDSYCPHGCGCDDSKLSVSCLRTDMKVMPISLNPSIEQLVLRYNQFTTVDASISFYPRLKTLDLTRNPIRVLPDKIFLSQQSLLSLQLARNNISTLSPLSFFGLNQLQTLNLSGNPLEHLPAPVFKELTHLNLLDLSFLKLSFLENDTFSGLTGLKDLRLNDNLLMNISWDWCSPLEGLEILDLSGNHLISLSSALQLPGLLKLDLGRNEIFSLSEPSFEGLVGLRALNLAENNLEAFPSSGLQALIGLQELDLSVNPFSLVPSHCLQANSNLRVLAISSCPHLWRVERHALAANQRLERVTVSGNCILGQLESGWINQDLASLVHLDISDNSISSVGASLNNFAGVANLQISGNPWHCNCSTLQLRRLIEEQILRGGSPMRRAQCSTPEMYSGIDLLYLPDTVCSDGQTAEQYRTSIIMYMSTVIFTAFIIISVIIIICVFSFHCFRRLFEENRFRSASSSTGTDETYCQVRGQLESPKSSRKTPKLPSFHGVGGGRELERLMEPEYPGGIHYFYREERSRRLPPSSTTSSSSSSERTDSPATDTQWRYTDTHCKKVPAKWTPSEAPWTHTDDVPWTPVDTEWTSTVSAWIPTDAKTDPRWKQPTDRQFRTLKPAQGNYTDMEFKPLTLAHFRQ